MDKVIDLKKPKKKRSNCDEIPTLTSSEYMEYVQSFFVENTRLDKSIEKKMASEIRKKLGSYKTQDVKKARYHKPSFITMDNVYEKLLTSKMMCYYCNEPVCVFYTSARQENQWTLERIDNAFQHTNENTVIACLDCNLKRSTRNSEHFQFAKQLTIKKI
jgi:hypothetical protein